MKKGQSEVITTVLIILLVLAAVFIVWQAVKGMITTKTGEISTRTGCIGTELTVISATASPSEIVVTREAGGTNEDADVTILVNGVFNLTNSTVKLGQLESLNQAIPGLVSGYNITVAAVLADGTVCAPSAVKRVR